MDTLDTPTPLHWKIITALTGLIMVGEAVTLDGTPLKGLDVMIEE